MHHSINWKKSVAITFLICLNGILLAQPAGYYNGTEGKSGEQLKMELNGIISHHVDFGYTFTENIINYSDADPANPDNVILFYSQTSRYGDNYGTGGDYINREHVWAKSHGGFTDELPMYTDCHNLRPADASVNEDRGNKDFDIVQPGGTQDSEATECYYTDSTWEPGPLTKGQVARILFYMATRYEGNDGEMDLKLVRHDNTYPLPEHGNLNALLKWNREYPPSDFERRRNERLYRIQQNRNPFVDHPEFADMIWENKTPDATTFSDFGISPEFPTPEDAVTISVTIQSDKNLNSVSLYWGTTYDPSSNQTAMHTSGSNYSADIQPTGFQAGDMLYLIVKAETADSTYSWRASYLYPEKVESSSVTPIPDVQGTSDVSPMNGQTVTVAGRVTANFDYSFYLQTNAKTHSGINVYNSLFRGKPGDSLIVTGTVSEYNNLTELGDVTYNYNYHSNKEVEPAIITTSDLNETYEGMLVKIRNVHFDKGGQPIVAKTSYNFSDSKGSGVIYISPSSRLVGKSLPLSNVDLIGILEQYKNTYQLIPRDVNDFKEYTPTAPILQKRTEVLTVFPNPSSEELTLNTGKSVSLVRIVDLTGQLKESGHPVQNKINIQDLAPGVYVLEVVFDDQSVGRCKFSKL